MTLFPEDESELDVPRYRSFARKMPPLYATVALVLLADMYVFRNMPSLRAAVLMPGCLVLVAVVRAVWWFRNGEAEITAELARQRLNRSIVVLMAGVTIAVMMQIMLFEYATEEQKHFLLFGMSCLGVIVLVCLIHLRRVAFLASAILIVPTAIQFMWMGTTTTILSGAILLAASVGVGISAISYYKDFAGLVKSKIEMARLGRENARLASLDMLTGLPNRRFFFTELEAALQAARLNGTKVAAGIVDLDGFKAVNDTYGHRVGDKVLSEVSRRLSCAVPELRTFCRMGGDEFAFQLDTHGDPETLAAIGRALITASEEHIAVGDLVVSVSCSIGLAVFPDMAGSVDELFERADFALYHAKRSGRFRAEIFSPEHQEEIASQGAIEQALRMADTARELYPVFQPIIDSGTGRTLAFECLARWDSPVLGPVSPAVFIPIAEKAGLINAITIVMLRKGLAAMANWPPSVGMSFNLSSHDITNTLSTMRIVALVQGSGIQPGRISFELTETALLHDFALARRNIETLKASGIKVALDEFGTGYSSLSHVQSLPLDKLKIDRRFVSDVEDNATSQMIVRSLVALCRGVGIGCVVEGAETEAQITMLRGLGCEAIQGYYYSRPIPADAVAAFLGRHEPEAQVA